MSKAITRKPKTDPLIRISRRLSRDVDALSFDAPITQVYNPLDYARAPHEAYLKRYGAGPKQALFMGMNPGPFGMAQTGVPFGDVAMVRDWLGIGGPVSNPGNEHPKRPIRGFDCERSEVSGTRFWGWAKARFETPERFFERFFVWNYCPLSFMEKSGRNFTPDKLPVKRRVALFEVCDAALRSVVTALSPEYVIGVGKFAEDRAIAALGGIDLKIGRILHPSPASPKANRDWPGKVEEELAAIGVELPRAEAD